MDEHPTSQILKDLLLDEKRQKSLERERAEADSKIEKLLSGPISEARSARFWTWGLCERLLERSWALRQHDPKGMLLLAQFAVEGSERISHRKYGAPQCADLRALAWAGLTNSYRISDQISWANMALKEAFLAYQQGTLSPLLRARLAEISASLLCDEREFPAAFRALDLAHSLYLENEAPHDAGRALITKGLHTGYTGDPEEGTRLLARGLHLIDKGRDPKLVFQALHNVLLFRVELRKYRIARRQIWEMRPLYNHHGDEIARVKLRGIEGKIFLGLGEMDRAIRAFEQAREGFLEKGLDYDAALVSFELVGVWLRLHKRDDVRRLLQEMLDTFRSRYVAREVIAVMVLLRDAAASNDLTLDLLDKASSLILRIKEGPVRRPEGGDADTLWG